MFDPGGAHNNGHTYPHGAHKGYNLNVGVRLIKIIIG